MIGNHRTEQKDAIVLLPSLFLGLLAIEIPTFLLRKNTKSSKKFKNSEEEETFQQFAQKIEDFFNQIIPLKTGTYARLFFNLMKEISLQKGDKWRFFAHQNRLVYIQLLTSYIAKERYLKKSELSSYDSSSNTNYTTCSDKEQFSPPDNSILSTSPTGFSSFLKLHNLNYHKNSPLNTITSYDSRVYLQEAKDLLNYLESHVQDPFSTLIGRKPSESIIKEALKHEGIDTPLSYGEIIIGISISNDSHNNNHQSFVAGGALISPRSTKSQSLLFTKKKKLSKSDLSHTSQFFNLRFSKNGTLKNGTFEKNNHYVFVRYLHANDDLTVETEISMDDHPNHTKRFAAFFRIPPSFVGALVDTTSPENLRNFIDNPCDELFKRILQLSKSKVVEYLREQPSFDYKLFETMEIYQYHNQRIKDYWTITRNELYLESLYSQIPQQFFDSLSEEAQEISKEFLTRNENILFIPTIEKELDLIKSYPKQALISSINAICGKYQNVMDDIKFQIKEVIEGNRKNTLLNWWLREISAHTHSFLSSKNYLHDAVPENYLEVPPACMKDVKFNLTLLKKILSSENSNYSPATIIEELKELIYPKINQLILDIKYSIVILLGEEEGLYECDDIKAKFQAKKNEIEDDQLLRNIENTLKDLDYLIEMIKLEDPIYASNSPSFHIVPISGLAYSTFFRLENECRTVMEYWSRRLPTVAVSPLKLGNLFFDSQSNTFQLKRAISIGDLSGFKQILQTSKTENRLEAINELDANGWNVFHCCAAKENLDMCEMLLNEEIDVNIQNCDGNSALHFLVRIKQPELEKQLNSIVYKVMGKGGNVHIVNKYQETPLHSCYRGFPSIGKILVLHQADPNYPNLRDETPLHYAVNAENLGMIKVLIAAGADPYIGNSSGDTPYSLAIRFKNPIAESLLTK